ncbi:uncharacterized protein cubi_00979 [Cryptosporidium ubiquitum]|uniref:Uncharacterized protein n=1 Tax=Cryptosporidium ubiquitum TaxID=857276 RepID=A0A1J4M9E2_9CRYT|nr:uncharacterized protein cubi_00979 [Cryptosporidium ubiquitum]OII70834.1 hypothetical protein cubi_00979 [Cryptosporidium ubiquitum]
MCIYLFILTAIFYFCKNRSTAVLLTEQVSLFQVSRLQNQPFLESKPLFDGKGNKEYKIFISEFGISDDLTTGKECSSNELNSLFEELKQMFIKYYSLKGSILDLKKKSISDQVQEQIEMGSKMYQEADIELKKLISKIFACIIIRTAPDYINHSTSQNHIGCSIHSYVYYLSMKRLSKKIIKLLEETLSKFSKSKSNCQLVNANFKQTSCHYLLCSLKAIKASIITETYYYYQYKRTQKNCKPFVQRNIYKLFLFK